MKTMITIKADREVKTRAQRLASDLGLSLSAVVNAYLRQFISHREIHITIPPRASAALEDLLGTVERDLRKGRNISRPISSARKLRAHLRSVP